MSDSLSRRDFIRSAALMATTAALAGRGVDAAVNSGQTRGTAASIATGTVFDDADHSGKLTPGKRGIAGVRVSNGSDVVRTDADGRYTIPLPANRTLFVIKPRDWMTPISASNLPQFYYHHYPTGTPDWRPDPKTAPREAFDPQWYYPGIAPSGPLPTQVNFPLIHRPEPDAFRTLVFGDPQPGTDDQLDYMNRTVVQELMGVRDVAFGVTLGDVVNVSKLEYLEPVADSISKIGLPWYSAIGNHDQNLIVPDDSLASVSFERVFGPTTYAFEHGPVSFIVLKNMIRAPFAGFDTATDSTGGHRPRGEDYAPGLQPMQWAFLENYLATVPKEKPLVLFMHIPIGIRQSHVVRKYEARLFKLLSGRPHTLSMSGHTHVQAHYFIGSDRGFTGPGEHHHFNSICVRGAGYRGSLDQLQIPNCMASDGCEQGYSFVTYDGNKYDIEYKAARRPADRQINIFLPKMVAAGSPGAAVQVNVFAGSTKSDVVLRVGDHEPVKLAYKLQPDPAMVEAIREQNSPTPWLGLKYKELTAHDSHHVWNGSLPAGLTPGVHVAEVTTTDMFGKTYSARRLFRVVDKLPNAALASSFASGHT